MLFDLRSPRRRRVVQVVFGSLAALFAVSFVFFGIGSEVQGGFGDLIGQGGGGDDAQDDAIEDAESKLETNPNDVAALAELVQLHYQSGTGKIEIDEETQQQNITSEAEQDLQEGVDAWQRYLAASGGQASPSTALLAVQTYATLAQGKLTQAAGGTGQQSLDDADDSIANWKGAAEAQKVVADQSKDVQSLATLASYYYFAGDFEQGDQIAQDAVAAAKGTEAKEVEKSLQQTEQRAQQITDAIDQFRKQLAKTGGGAGAPGENPLEGVGGGGLSGGGFGGGSGLTAP